MVIRQVKICDYCNDLNKTRVATAIFERHDGEKYDVCAECVSRIQDAGLANSLEWLNQ